MSLAIYATTDPSADEIVGSMEQARLPPVSPADRCDAAMQQCRRVCPSRRWLGEREMIGVGMYRKEGKGKEGQVIRYCACSFVCVGSSMRDVIRGLGIVCPRVCLTRVKNCFFIGGHPPLGRCGRV